MTAAVVRYTTLDTPRQGVLTTFLQDSLCVGEKCPVFISRNPDFRLPDNQDAPIILIGPGTGLAPYMAFIQERGRICMSPFKSMNELNCLAYFLAVLIIFIATGSLSINLFFL